MVSIFFGLRTYERGLSIFLTLVPPSESSSELAASCWEIVAIETPPSDEPIEFYEKASDFPDPFEYMLPDILPSSPIYLIDVV